MAKKIKVEIDTSKLLKRMKRYEEVTGKEVAASLRRGARLLAVNLAASTPPFGKDATARKLGERAVQNDIRRIYTPATPISTKYPTTQWSFQEQIQKFLTKSPKLQKAILAAVKAADPERLKGIVSGLPTFSKLTFDHGVDRSVHARTRNAYGRVRKGWKGRNVVMNSLDLQFYIQRKQDLVGLTKAAWAACALDVRADVKDALSGIPAWVKRHVGKVSHAVVDGSEKSLPIIKLTSKVPWADKALRSADHKEAIRISREKFYKSLGIEIRMALKSAREEG
jgi:hypothetical protein